MAKNPGSAPLKGDPEIWGLTGGVASGKSTVAAYFAELGIPVIDADVVVRELGAPGGAAHETIVKRFGTGDRMKLRDIVFHDKAARKDLEAILHPLVQSESLRRMKQLAGQGVQGPFVYEAALLVETERYKSLQGLIVVEAPRAARVQRLLARDRITAELAERMIDSQISDVARRAAASDVIENTGTLEELRGKVLEFIRRRGWR